MCVMLLLFTIDCCIFDVNTSFYFIHTYIQKIQFAGAVKLQVIDNNTPKTVHKFSYG